MANRNALSDMVIDEISLVDDPANEHSRVMIVKAKAANVSTGVSENVAQAMDHIAPRLAQLIAGLENPTATDVASAAEASLTEYTMDLDTLSKALEEAEERMENLEATVSDSNDKLAQAAEVIKARDAEIEELKKAAGRAPEDSEAEILKSLPESIRKRLEDAEVINKANAERIAKMEEEAETSAAIAKAKTLGVGDPAVIGPMLMRITKGKTTPEDAAAFEGLLKGAAAQRETAKLFSTFGSDSKAGDDPETLLKAKAVEIKKARPELTDQAAYAVAMDQNPDLYTAYVAKSNRRVASA